MFVAFSPIFVVDTQKNFDYKFGAPLAYAVIKKPIYTSSVIC